jgi:hypothetical protein
MTPAIFAIAIGTFGAILQELLVWYNARKKLETEEYRALFASTKYWTVVTAMAIGAGIAAWVWFYPDQQAPRSYLLFGAAFPVLFKKAVDAFIPAKTALGQGPEDKQVAARKNVLRNYFQAS